MRRFRKPAVVAWTVFLTVFLPGVGGPGESVLCFGADGHVAVEAAVSPGACYSASVAWRTPVDAPERELSREPDHCGPCADVLSLSGPWANFAFSSQISGHAGQLATSPSPAFLQTDEIPALPRDELLTVRACTPAGAPCAFLRTTVLLI
ncbi:MAG: hypothetical protein ACM31N_07255 [Deltaproteobacteria bacterium]